MTLFIQRKYILILFWLCAMSVSAAGITGMRVEYSANPVGIDAARPRFSWQMMADAGRHGQRQKAWQIVVADERGRRVWDSGRRKDARSLGITYSGEALRPSTRYAWHLTVWDDAGHAARRESVFETGLMGDTAWGGAAWIGGTPADMPLYAHYLPVFRLSVTVRLDRATATSRAAFVYGANDRRLMDADKNILGMASGPDQSYIKVELDASRDTARLNVYRAGYRNGDNPQKPLGSFAIPTEQISPSNRYAAHTVSLTSVLGTTRFYIDGSSREIGRAELNPMGRGGDFIAFPVLGDYGFVVDEGRRAVFSDVRVGNYRSPSNTLATLVADTVVSSPVLRTTAVPVTASPMLRTEFMAGRAVNRARLYVTSRGVYRFFVNGTPVGDEWLTPGFTQYNKTHHYQTYDVTPMLRTGLNAMGAMLAEGWWSGGMTYSGDNWNMFGDRQSLRAMLVLTYTDGDADTIVTASRTWRYCADGPVRAASLFQGEVYDGIRGAAMAGWSRPGYNASAWHPAVEIATEGIVSTAGDDGHPRVDDFSALRLTGCNDAGVRAVDTLTAQTVERVRPGVFVYDMGQNMAGVPLIRMRGLRPGTRVTLRFAEVKYPSLPRYAGNEGMIMLENIRAAMAQDIYVARGGEEEFCPRFTYHGYRYVELTGVDEPLPVGDVRGVALSSVDGLSAGYETSRADVNRLWQNITWSMRANFFSIPTDCPQRNERMGWAGDISVFSPTASYMGFVPAFLGRYVMAMRDVQRPDGKFLDIAPVGGGFGGILWGSAGITVPWQCYVHYGDSVLLSGHYDAMCRYVDFILNETLDPQTGIIVQQKAWGDLADWLGPEDNRNDRSLLWEACFIHDLDIMTRAAATLGRTSDEARFAQLASGRRQLFNRTYIHPVTAKTVWSAFDPSRCGQLVDTQTSYVLPLAFNIVADSLRSRFTANLAATVTRTKEGHGPCSLLTGFIGTAWVSNVLSDNGHTDLAYRMLLNTGYPSWLYSVSQGATTIWERLDSYTHKDGFGGNNRMNSFNHYSFGSVGEWMMSRSLGIRRDEASPAFARFVLAPEPDPTGMMTSARGHYDSMYGRIESSWTRAGGKTEYAFTVPPNTTATLRLRATAISGGMKGARVVSRKGGQITMELQSGKYQFITK